MLKQRVLTVLLALPLFLALLILAPKWVLIPFFMCLVGLGTFEMASMLVPRLENAFNPASQQSKPPLWIVPTAVGFACLIFLGSSVYSADGGRGMVLAGMLGGILIGSFFAPDNETAFARTVALLVSIVYGSFPWLATWDLFLMGEGSRYVLYLCTVVWAGDTGAYFGGKQFGKHKLAPRMSPKKTWEGSIAGLIASVAGGLICNAVYQGQLGPWLVIGLASLVGGAFGQMGDLVESTFKRFSGVKDSGVVFPGHGGFLDRVDGLLFAAPVIWFILYNLGK
ncbi:phosphatidate cytidylyltransferase [Pseudobacteriovorax antillogorgiicola]|uniref:Phosphatidate cytidylyltransferase n=1 Tax=Pseudobacteriovorax antillogorgiicola TaxID=1513793 RepID=A0A1Y6B232_9BACT|nr:phosphatidate cytidylyltransferase [Pseudobacteriovorax antillogorgiicola]TCS59546.1 phosphatidate cytidylyltransferase [Pseudobacteriovorax antillogorgiicola]SME87759.1 phosphatidate cytidylyltransferase [Pseudobacteriovorax antillogorgiicola]